MGAGRRRRRLDTLWRFAVIRELWSHNLETCVILECMSGERSKGRPQRKLLQDIIEDWTLVGINDAIDAEQNAVEKMRLSSAHRPFF